MKYTLDKYGYTFYEVKFTKSPIDDAVVNEEKTQLSKAGISYNRLGFISKSGFRIDDNENYILIPIEDMYVYLAVFRILDHLQKLHAMIDRCSRNTLIGIHADKRPIVVLIDVLRVMLDL